VPGSGVSGQRRREDLAKLRALQSRLPQVLTILGVSGDPPRSISLRIALPTAVDAKFPATRQAVSEVEIQLPETYPLPPGPLVLFRTPIWNPNVYASGKWCFGEWKMTENLELFVKRLMQVIALDPAIINTMSPANADAAKWYDATRVSQPKLFPTASVDALAAPAKPDMVWRPIR
jgi:hypothetical protein